MFKNRTLKKLYIIILIMVVFYLVQEWGTRSTLSPLQGFTWYVLDGHQTILGGGRGLFSTPPSRRDYTRYKPWPRAREAGLRYLGLLPHRAVVDGMGEGIKFEIFIQKNVRGLYQFYLLIIPRFLYIQLNGGR